VPNFFRLYDSSSLCVSLAFQTHRHFYGTQGKKRGATTPSLTALSITIKNGTRY
jgi:hypothetical protein